MTQVKYLNKISIFVSIVLMVVFAFALSSCAEPKSPQDRQGESTFTGEPDMDTTMDYTANIDLASIPEVATEEDIQKYCANCHLQDEVAGWDKTSVNEAIVDSMLFPTISSGNDPEKMEALDKSIANYFAQIEPSQEGEQH